MGFRATLNFSEIVRHEICTRLGNNRFVNPSNYHWPTYSYMFFMVSTPLGDSKMYHNIKVTLDLRGPILTKINFLNQIQDFYCI